MAQHSGALPGDGSAKDSVATSTQSSEDHNPTVDNKDLPDFNCIHLGEEMEPDAIDFAARPEHADPPIFADHSNPMFLFAQETAANELTRGLELADLEVVSQLGPRKPTQTVDPKMVDLFGSRLDQILMDCPNIALVSQLIIAQGTPDEWAAEAVQYIPPAIISMFLGEQPTVQDLIQLPWIQTEDIGVYGAILVHNEPGHTDWAYVGSATQVGKGLEKRRGDRKLSILQKKSNGYMGFFERLCLDVERTQHWLTLLRVPHTAQVDSTVELTHLRFLYVMAESVLCSLLSAYTLEAGGVSVAPPDNWARFPSWCGTCSHLALEESLRTCVSSRLAQVRHRMRARERHERVKADPVLLERQRAQQQEYQRKAKTDPRLVARQRERTRERQRKIKADPKIMAQVQASKHQWYKRSVANRASWTDNERRAHLDLMSRRSRISRANRSEEKKRVHAARDRIKELQWKARNKSHISWYMKKRLLNETPEARAYRLWRQAEWKRANTGGKKY